MASSSTKVPQVPALQTPFYNHDLWQATSDQGSEEYEKGRPRPKYSLTNDRYQSPIPRSAETEEREGAEELQKCMIILIIIIV